jgi:hypothetical protein
MTIIIDTINALPDMSANDPATENAVIEAEKQLGLSFADEYKTYILNFGKVTAFGIELTGIVGSKYLNVVKETQQNWNFYTQVPHTLYVIEDACIVVLSDGKTPMVKYLKQLLIISHTKLLILLVHIWS